MASMSALFCVLRKKCDHAQEPRSFKAYDFNMSISKIETTMKCHADGLMEVSLATSEGGPWTKLVDDELYDLPIGAIVSQFPGTKYIRLECVPEDKVEDETYTASPLYTSNVKKDAFSMMMSQRQTTVTLSKKTSSSGVSQGLSRKDELYNDILDWMSSRQMSFTSAEEGKYISQVLTNILWYITNQHSVINERSKREASVQCIPPVFDDFQGYNEHKRKKLKAQPMQSDQLKSHAETLFSLCTRPIMRTSEAWENAYKDIKALGECLLSYHEYLEAKKLESEHNRNLDHPARQIDKHCSVFTVCKTVSEVRQKYKLLDKALTLADYYEPIFFDATVHVTKTFENNMQRLRFFETLQLSVTVDIIKYCPGGGILTTWCLFKVPDERNDTKKQTDAASCLLKIRRNLTEYHTRFMKQEFKMRPENVASIKPSVVDMIYKELSLDASAALHPDSQQRIRLIFVGDTGLLADLRKLNTGRPNDHFDVFFSKLGEIIEENTAADDRRHNQAHMSKYLSIRDLINQTQEQCPPGTEIPSGALVRLQFMPRNPYSMTALSFTSKLPVQYKIQRRQLRLSHVDDHYMFALFKYLRCFAVYLGTDCSLYCCDDKAKVHIGEPGTILSTGVRGKKTITSTSSTLVAADHDMSHKGSFTPSVYFKCDLPESADKSFYRGKVTTVINDSIFQSSNPMRHAAAVAKIEENSILKSKVLLKFTDGGTDHRNTLEHVKCSLICLFKELDLDMVVACRCAPGQSFINPAERIMSILNLGLQNCGLSREISSDETEALLKKCNSMDSVPKTAKDHPEIKDDWEMSIEPVRWTLANRFRRLTLKGEPVDVMDPLSEEEIDLLTHHLNYLFPRLNTEKLVKAETSKIQEYCEWVDTHCRQRQYSFQIKKCDNQECCSPATLKVDWLPDPMLDDTKEHYQPFLNLYGKETSEIDRPTYQQPEAKITIAKPCQTVATVDAKGTSGVKAINIIPDNPELNGKASVYIAQNARLTLDCVECNKPRLLYSVNRLNERTRYQLAMLLSETDYTCGSPITSPKDSLHGKVFVRLNIDCSMHLETSYYSALHYNANLGQPDRCFYCSMSGAETDTPLKSKFKTVYPLCSDCKGKGFQFCCARPFGKKT